MKIKIQLKPGAELPQRATANAGGWDIKAHRIEQVAEDLVIVHTGLIMEPEEGYKIALVPRSSLTKTNWILQNSPGLGDQDFRGEYQFRFRAIPDGLERESKEVFEGNESLGSATLTFLSYPNFPYKEGERIGQMYVEEVIPIEWEEAEELTETERGTGGYGSTGV